MINILIIFCIVVLFMQYVIVILLIQIGEYKNKKEVYRDCIPFSWIFYSLWFLIFSETIKRFKELK